jgi:hypothetical protein
VPGSRRKYRVSTQPVIAMIKASSSTRPARLIGHVAISDRLSSDTVVPIDMPISRNEKSRIRSGMPTGAPSKAAAATQSAPPMSQPPGSPTPLATAPPIAEISRVRTMILIAGREMNDMVLPA